MKSYVGWLSTLFGAIVKSDTKDPRLVSVFWKMLLFWSDRVQALLEERSDLRPDASFMTNLRLISDETAPWSAHGHVPDMAAGAPSRTFLSAGSVVFLCSSVHTCYSEEEPSSSSSSFPLFIAAWWQRAES